MKVRDVLKLLKNDGWDLVATEGSHRQYKHATKAWACNRSREAKGRVAAGHILNSIMKQAGLKK
ncbi:MAG TPA: type II toxin-antitoxin system HicA family toxin [Blastocatellia bacterium]|nr:type II toxin-antitoxin system HicA family toxin [Blastocatellia bacterium]